MILLVEDDELMLRVTRQLLEDRGFRVLEAKEGKSAQDIAELPQREN
jgi:CheY-like chemotaxis protein